MTEAQEQQLDREFAAWLTRHNFPDNLPEHCLKPLRTAALLVSGFEADKTASVSPAATNHAQGEQERPQGFPKPDQRELKTFWSWIDTKAAKGTLLADEKHYLTHETIIASEPPKYLLERYRRECEQ